MSIDLESWSSWQRRLSSIHVDRWCKLLGGIPPEVAVLLTVKLARFGVLSKRSNDLQKPLIIEWE